MRHAVVFVGCIGIGYGLAVVNPPAVIIWTTFFAVGGLAAWVLGRA